jgi:hypothetical protein
MEELLLNLLDAIAEIFLEVLLEFVSEMMMDLIFRGLRKFSRPVSWSSPFLAAFLFVLPGAVIGLLSVFVFPHPLLHPSRVHGISLLISPLLTGLAMSQVEHILRRHGREVLPH